MYNSPQKNKRTSFLTPSPFFSIFFSTINYSKLTPLNKSNEKNAKCNLLCHLFLVDGYIKAPYITHSFSVINDCISQWKVFLVVWVKKLVMSRGKSMTPIFIYVHSWILFLLHGACCCYCYFSKLFPWQCKSAGMVGWGEAFYFVDLFVLEVVYQ